MHAIRGGAGRDEWDLARESPRATTIAGGSAAMAPTSPAAHRRVARDRANRRDAAAAEASGAGQRGASVRARVLRRQERVPRALRPGQGGM